MSQLESRALQFHDKHEAALREARQACLERRYFTLFPETPDRHRGGAAAAEAGAAAFRAQLGKPFELDQPGTVGRLVRRSVAVHPGAAGHRLPTRRSRRAVRRGARRDGRLGRGDAARAARHLHGDRRPPLRGRVRDRAGGHAHRRAERADELRGQRHECAGSRRRGARLCLRGDGRGARGGDLGAALRFFDNTPAQALPPGAARGRGVLRLRYVPDLERLPGDACEPRDRQCGDRQAAPDRDPADGAGRAHLPARAGGGGFLARPRDPLPRRRRRPDRQASGEASADRDRRFHRQRALRRLGRGERAPGAVFLRDLRRQHGRGRVGGGARTGAEEPGHDDEPVLGADVHVAAERLRAARRHPLWRPAHRCRRVRRGARRSDRRDRQRPASRGADHGGHPVAGHAGVDRPARRRGRAARARAARLGAVRERRVPAGANPHAAAARRRIGCEGSLRRGTFRADRLRDHDDGSRCRAGRGGGRCARGRRHHGVRLLDGRRVPGARRRRLLRRRRATDLQPHRRHATELRRRLQRLPCDRA